MLVVDIAKNYLVNTNFWSFYKSYDFQKCDSTQRFLEKEKEKLPCLEIVKYIRPVQVCL